jgi:hypothetical protein
MRGQLVEVDCGGQTRLSLPYPTLVLPSQVRLLEFIFPVLSCSVWLLRAACYATLRYAWPDWRRAAPKRCQPTGPPFPTEQVKLVNQLSPLTRFRGLFLAVWAVWAVCVFCHHSSTSTTSTRSSTPPLSQALRLLASHRRRPVTSSRTLNDFFEISLHSLQHYSITVASCSDWNQAKTKLLFLLDIRHSSPAFIFVSPPPEKTVCYSYPPFLV